MTAPAPLVAERRPIHVVQGEHYVSADPQDVVTTILGSCVAACVRDPVAGLGGMNHFLLPGVDRSEAGAESQRYGVHAMELLLNALLARGARRERLEVKLFGGACLMQGLTDVGKANAEFAEAFVRREGLRHVGGSLRGGQGRRVQYWPVSGRARQVLLADQTKDLVAREARAARPTLPEAGGLELF